MGKLLPLSNLPLYMSSEVLCLGAAEGTSHRPRVDNGVVPNSLLLRRRTAGAAISLGRSIMCSAGICALALVALQPGLSPLGAQQAGVVAGVGVVASSADSVPTPPLSAGKAFLYSFMLPGYSQSVLDRPTATVLFAGMEIVGLAMIQRSLDDLRQAKRFARDSIVETYQIDPATGKVQIDPDTELPIVATYATDKYSALVPLRRAHVEDWIAIVVFNHLVAGIDALVASLLWDVPASVGVSRSSSGTMLMGRIPW